MKEDLLPFDMEKKPSSIIKVIGVGGGGSNAVKNMHREGITGVDFIICNTDKQALDGSSIETKIQLGPSLTEGLGAGSKPERGRESAIESIDEVRKYIGERTKMVFITAGMGGGTGTGAAPVIAEIAGEMEVLTVGIVTIPFRYEGKQRNRQAMKGIAEMTKHVDALLVVNNEKLREMYGNLVADEAFKKADDVLTVAAKGIAEIITMEGYINVDFADVKTVMSNSGIALMGSGKAKGEDRALKAVEDALTSPLLDNNDIKGAKNLLINISYSDSHKATMDEISDINEIVQEAAGNEADLIFGSTQNNTLNEYVAVTIIATGFQPFNLSGMRMWNPEGFEQTKKKEVVDLNKESEKSDSHENDEHRSNEFDLTDEFFDDPDDRIDREDDKAYELRDRNVSQDPFLENEMVFGDKEEAGVKYSQSSETRKVDDSRMTASDNVVQNHTSGASYMEDLKKYEDIPAYKRRKIQLGLKDDYSSEGYSRLTLSKDASGPKIRKNNQYLHDNSD